MAYLRLAIDEFAHLAEGEPRDRIELSVQLALCSPLNATTGFGSEEATRTYDRARALCESLNAQSELFPVLHGNWMAHVVHGTNRLSFEDPSEILLLGEQLQDDIAMLQGHRLLSLTQFFHGDMEDSSKHALAALSLGYCSRGLLDQATQTIEGALLYTRDLDHPSTLAYVMAHGAVILGMMAGDDRLVSSSADELIELSTQQRFPFYLPWGRFGAGWVKARSGETETGISLMRAAIEERGAGGQIYCQSLCHVLLAGVYLEHETTQEALTILEAALALAEETEERFWEAEIYRLRGVACLMQMNGEEAQAEANFRKGVKLARAQGSRLLELRSATMLAQLLLSQNKASQARGELEPVYASFTEGFAAADLTGAKTLLKQLS